MGKSNWVIQWVEIYTPLELLDPPFPFPLPLKKNRTERHKARGLMSKTTLHALFAFLRFSRKQRLTSMLNFNVWRRTEDMTVNFSFALCLKSSLPIQTVDESVV